VFSIMASRSCAYECLFCPAKAFWGRLRLRSATNVVEEIKSLHQRYGARYFIFEDDAFSLKKDWALAVCEGILKNAIDIRWAAQTRTDRFDKELAMMMKKAGCRQLLFGIESGSSTILKTLNKHQHIENIPRAFAIAREAGLPTIMSLVIGTPGETDSTMEETKQMLRRSRPSVVVANALRVYPGTGLFEHAKKQGLIDESVFLSEITDLIYTGAMTKQEIYRWEARLYLYAYGRLLGWRGICHLVAFLWQNIFKNPRLVGRALRSILLK